MVWESKGEREGVLSDMQDAVGEDLNHNLFFKELMLSLVISGVIVLSSLPVHFLMSRDFKSELICPIVLL